MRVCTVPSMSASMAHLVQVPSALSVAETAIISHEFGFTVQSRATATNRPECWSNRTRVSNGKSAGSPGVGSSEPEIFQRDVVQKNARGLVEHPEIADRQGDEVKGPRRPHRVGGDHVPAVRGVHQTLEGAREYGSQGCDGDGDLPGRQRRRREGCRRGRNVRALPRTPGNPMGMDGAPFPGLRRSGGVESSYFDDRAPDKRHFPRDLRPSRAILGNRTGISG